MRLIDIAVHNVRRKKGRTFFLVSGLALGIGAAVALTSIGDAMNREVMRSLDEFGANILVLPATEDLPLSYGGLTVSAVNTGGRMLTSDDAAKIRTVKNAMNISTIAPKLLVVSKIANRRVLVAGVDFPSEFKLKKWWRLSAGLKPASQGDALLGKDAATALGLTPGNGITINGAQLRVAGVLDRTGSQDDGLVFADIAWVQDHFRRGRAISLIELSE